MKVIAVARPRKSFSEIGLLVLVDERSPPGARSPWSGASTSAAAGIVVRASSGSGAEPVLVIADR